MSRPDAFAERRFGRIRIAAPMLRRDFAGVQRVCAELVSLRVELMAMTDELVIEGASPHFDVIEYNMLVPDYTAILDEGRVRFERQSGPAMAQEWRAT
jgi:hypothetical protein